MFHMITNDSGQQKVTCHAPLPLWPDVRLFYQCKCYLHHTNIRSYRLHWPTKAREYNTLVKNNFHFDRCENNSNVNTIITTQKHTYPPLGNLLGIQMEMY